MKPIARTPQNYQLGDTPNDTEGNFGVSQTIPDQTMSLHELLTRFARGQSVQTLTPVYDGEDEMPDVSRMDPMERLDYARHIKRQIHDFQNRPAPEPEPGPAPPPGNPGASDFEEAVQL